MLSSFCQPSPERSHFRYYPLPSPPSAAMSPSSPSTGSLALTKRPSPSSTAMMPPPPPSKRIKRPAKVLDEDDYTDALSKIIARDYFPGLLESQAQQEYLSALESSNPAWITQAGARLRDVMTPGRQGSARKSIPTQKSQNQTPLPSDTPLKSGTNPDATPRGFTGDETPASSVAATETPSSAAKPEIDTSNLSLSGFQSKYTSEDNESFNALLDKQNNKRRAKHAYLWGQDQRIPSARQVAHRAREARLLKQKEDDEANGKAVIPITVGETGRPTRPDSWTIKKPDNTLMFPAGSVDEDGLETVAEVKESTSRMGPKQVIHANTRIAPPALHPEASEPVPPSPSLSAVRDAIAGRPRLSASELEAIGNETPRVNGYSFVDEDEPDTTTSPNAAQLQQQPTYRDLLAGQAPDPTPNPFKIGEIRKREDLHHRMVERQARQNRPSGNPLLLLSNRYSQDTPSFASSPALGSRTTPKTGARPGSLTPAAKRLLDRVSRTPVRAAPGTAPAGATTPFLNSHTKTKNPIPSRSQGGRETGDANMWTPTPRKKTAPANTTAAAATTHY